MQIRSDHTRQARLAKSFDALLLACLLSFHIPLVTGVHHMKRTLPPSISQRAATIPLKITNQCKEDIYPGIGTQAGTPPSTQGFLLKSGSTRDLTVGTNWQGRVWGRTNCSFNAAGTGPSNVGGLNGGGEACLTGDCNGVVDCVVTVRICQ